MYVISSLFDTIKCSVFFVLSRAGLGADWAPPSGIPKQVQADVSMQRLSEDFDTMGLEGQAYYVLSKLRAGEGSHPDVQKGTNLWTGRIRVGGRTGYISAEEGSSKAASKIIQALVRFLRWKGVSQLASSPDDCLTLAALSLSILFLCSTVKNAAPSQSWLQVACTVNRCHSLTCHYVVYHPISKVHDPNAAVYFCQVMLEMDWHCWQWPGLEQVANWLQN